MKLYYGVTVCSTETFRFAMHKHPFLKGCNAQTLPKSLRYYLVPPKGRIFVQGDLSQAEARVVAYLSRCNNLIEAFSDPSRNIHKENAIAVLGHEVEKDSPEYVLAKMVVHASNYRMGAYKFSANIGLPVSACKQLLANYHAKRPEIYRWHAEVWNEVKQLGYLTTPLGDKRWFYEAMAAFSSQGKMLDTHWKDAIAWVPQTTVPHVTNIGIIDTNRSLNGETTVKWLRPQEYSSWSRFCWWHHQGHDSFLASIPDGEEVRFVESAQSRFAVPLIINGRRLIIPIELAFGYSFGDLMPYRGSSIGRSEWQTWLDAKLAKRSREADILQGMYGTHLSAWRPT